MRNPELSLMLYVEDFVLPIAIQDSVILMSSTSTKAEGLIPYALEPLRDTKSCLSSEVYV